MRQDRTGRTGGRLLAGILAAMLTIVLAEAELTAGCRRPAAEHSIVHGARPIPTPASATDAVVTHLSEADLQDAAASDPRPFAVPGFPLPRLGHVDLSLRRFQIITDETRFVAASPGGDERELHITPDRYRFFYGSVLDFPGSRVFLGFSEEIVYGTIDLGPGLPSFAVTAESTPDVPLDPGEVAVFETVAMLGQMPDAPLCGTDTSEMLTEGGEGDTAPPGTRHVQIAVDTDHEFYLLFGDLTEAADYVVMLYGAIAAIYIRDVGVNLSLTYVRLWDEPDGLYETGNPLPMFRSHWNQHMGHVHRHVAQLLTARRDLPWGGVASGAGLCTNAAYSVNGHLLGWFPSLDRPAAGHWDINVVAHELGHNLGSAHTHSYGIDNCHTNQVTRGTIMSYCFTQPGGLANEDLRFCTVTAGVMRNRLASSLADCVGYDCNLNAVDDEIDIATGYSQDINNDGIPDECQDCNNSGNLDPDDIESGRSRDLNNNGIPDECEPDCNGTGRPDDMDIADGTSQDRNLDGVPDECAVDCNNSGIPDFWEIMQDMSLDADRDGVLDECQDCTGDGVPDHIVLDGSHNLWAIASGAATTIHQYHGRSGAPIGPADVGHLSMARDMDITPDRRILVVDYVERAVVEYAPDGSHVGDYIPSEAIPAGAHPNALLALSPGRVLVAYQTDDETYLYEHDSSGAVARVFDGHDPGFMPWALAQGPDGHLYVAGTVGTVSQVLRYDAHSGELLGTVVTSHDDPELDQPRGLAFSADGDLLVASHNNSRVLAYDAHTGEPRGHWDRGSLTSFWRMYQPRGMRNGPDGDVFVTSSTGNAGLLRYDGRTGQFLRTYYLIRDQDLTLPTAFAFMPDNGTDCNRNFRPDQCDIAMGYSRDRNNSGVPDECECLADWNGDGQLDVNDFFAFLADFEAGDPRADLNLDGEIDINDFLLYLEAFDAGC